ISLSSVSTLYMLPACWALSTCLEMDGITQPNPLMTVQTGDTVTLQCFFSEDERYISWFKQKIGQNPHLMASAHQYSDVIYHNGFNQTRFKVQRQDLTSQLIISKTEPSDSATYYCSRMWDFVMFFGAGTFLISNGRTILQQPVSDPVHPGDSVTLQCTVDSETCAGEHSVYWFRHGSGESLPGLIYTHGKRSDECEKSPEAGSPTHGCVYSLPKRNLSRSDAGIYYCAVLTCGDILFGNGTQLEIEGKFYFLYIQNVHSFSKNNLLLISSSQNYDAEMLNYAALNFANKKPTTGRKKRHLNEESVYSRVR
uniref:Ig-like domain-containing protein n=1 Tax=Scleropages formosus TaxID=113540 RepID=A0A8C9R073_SCLFO